jgi:REP element-mobilizing transposase RayT
MRKSKSRQGELPLWRGKRGGWRPGAGRKPGPKPPVAHEPRERFRAAHPCLVTLKVREGVASLRNGAVIREIEETFRQGAERGEFRLVHYSLQSDHLHALVEADGPQALGRGMKSLAARFALAVNRALGRRGPLLRERYHLRVLTSPTQVRNALRYVLLNVRKHWAQRRGSRELPGPVRLDPASSARWFPWWRPGTAGAEEAASNSDPPAVRAPRTWLLAVGWRRLGLLDPAEVPGSRDPIGIAAACPGPSVGSRLPVRPSAPSEPHVRPKPTGKLRPLSP